MSRSPGSRPTTDPSFEDVWDAVGREVRAFREEVRHLPVAPDIAPGKLRAELEDAFDLFRGIGLPKAVEHTVRLLREGTLHVTSPRYFGLYNPTVLEAGLVGDALAALYNPQLAAWSHAPAATELERIVLRRFSGALGLPPEGVHASFTTGGSEANLSAVLAALAHHFPDSGVKGLSDREARPVIYLSEASHHSFVKIARMSGLGTAALREVPLMNGYRMDPRELTGRIQEDLEAGLRPFLVVATAGSTSSGAVDPIPDIAWIARAFGCWLHVDAAWAGAVALSPRLRGHLAGIDRADSVTWDAHKWLSVPMGAGMFFCRHPEAVLRAFTVSTSYMPPKAAPGFQDPYASTVQWSRRAIGLKVFTTLAAVGEQGYAELIEHQTHMGDALRVKLEEAGWKVVNDSPLPVVCFNHPDLQANRRSNCDILREIYRRNRVWISDVLLGPDTSALRACITSYQTREEDLDCLVEELEAARTTLLRTHPVREP